MAKARLAEPMGTLEGEIIETLLAGHKEYRPDLGYPQSHSDMSAAVRGLLRMFDVKRLPIARELEYDCDTCRARGRLYWYDDKGVRQEQPCPNCKRSLT